MDDALQVGFLRSYQREALAEIEAHLVAKNASRSGSGTITFVYPCIDNMSQQLKILLHGLQVKLSCKTTKRGSPIEERANANVEGMCEF